MRVVSSSLFVVGALVSLPAWAAGRARVPAECPAAHTIESAMRDRFPADDDWSITVEGHGGGAYRGVIERPAFRRELSASSCAALIEALILAASLTEPEPAPEPVAKPEVTPAALPQPETPPAAAERPTPNPSRRSSVALFAGAEARASTFIAETVLPSAALDVAAGFGAPLPHVRAGVERSLVATVERSSGTARFVKTAGHAEGCPKFFALGPLSFAPCGRVTAGVLDAEATGVGARSDVSRVWLAAAGALRATTTLGAVPFDAQVGVEAPLVRDRFVTATDAHRTPPALVFLALGARGRIL